MSSELASTQMHGRADIVRQAINVVALIVTLVVNYLANALPLNGQTTSAISDRFPVLFVPAGYAFAIWGVIYLALSAFTVYQALPAQRTNPLLRRVGYLFAATCVVNSAWIFFWQYELFALTVAAMLGLLALLVAIYLRLDIGRARVAPIARWVVHLPFSIYLGWISVATIANITDVLYLTGWHGGGLSGERWATVLLVVATLLASALAVTRRDLAYALVIAWAFAGIAVKQWAAPAVAIPALGLAGLVAIVAVLSVILVRPRRAQFRTPAI